jgi:6,7-dimethyl-8-ribityllumazine synthase
MPKLVLIMSEFNQPYPQRLLDGALAAVNDHNIPLSDVTIVKVPGAFELPITAKAYALKKEIDAVVCLGVVIRGDTTHYDYVCAETARGIMQVGLDTLKPILFGVLTTENEHQAEVRSLPDTTNKGYECVVGALTMLNVLP